MLRMRVNSSAAAIETPTKNDDSENIETTVVGTARDLFKRTSPSKGLVRLLDSVCRLHKFYHFPQMVPLEDMKLTLKLRNLVRKMFADYDGDLEDWMLEIEASSVPLSSFMRDYIKYEFEVEIKYSFAVCILLNYLKNFSLEPEAGFAELFGISLTETVCEECYLKKGVAQKDIGSSNLKFLKCAISLNVSDEAVEDSDDDPDFKLEQPLEEKEDSELESDSEPVLGHENHGVEDVLTNPFIDADDDFNDPFEFKDELGINPFVCSDDESSKSHKDRKLLGPRSSSVKARKEIECEHCQKSFQNLYNLKLHCIQIHRIFPVGVKVFKCPESQCEFVTGSKVCYSRHATTHLRRISKTRKENVKKIVCSQCGISLANKSSLSRHIKRRHLKF